MTLVNPDSLNVKRQEMNAEIARVEARVMSAISELMAQNGSGGGGMESPGGFAEQLYDPTVLSPFMMYWDDENNAWSMHLPTDSLVFNGKYVPIAAPGGGGSGEGYSAGTWYLHIKKNGTAAKISDNATENGYQWHVKLAKIGYNDDEGEFLEEQYLIGGIILGGGSGSGDILEPEYDDKTGQITGVKNPYVLVGRQYISVSGTPVNGTNVLRIDHSGEAVTASIVSGSMPPAVPTLTKTEIALYKIEDNMITEDYRNLLTVPMYDLDYHS